MDLCGNILSVYLHFVELRGLSDSMGSTMRSMRCLFSFVATFLMKFYYRKLSLQVGILLASLMGALLLPLSRRTPMRTLRTAINP